MVQHQSERPFRALPDRQRSNHVKVRQSPREHDTPLVRFRRRAEPINRGRGGARMAMGSNRISTDQQEINPRVGQREQHVFEVWVEQRLVP